MKKISIAFFFLCFAFLVGIYFYFSPKDSSVTQASLPMQSLSLTTIDGKTVHFSDLKNKLILVNFFATWCPPCKQELTEFSKLSSKYPDAIVIISVSLDEDPKVVSAFFKEHPVSYPIVMSNPKLVQIFGQPETIPYTHLVGPDFKILDSISGAHDLEYFENLILNFL